jgi:hypothetical protein
VYNASLWSLFMKAGLAGISALFCALSLQAATLRITGGVVDYQVFQRGADNRADIAVSGSSDANGKTVEGAPGAQAGPGAGF